MNVLSARRRTMRARVHADCRRSSRKERGKSYQKPDCYRQSRTGLAALNDRRCCPYDSWLQRGNICLKTCTSFKAGFMPEIAVSCVKKLAVGAPITGRCCAFVRKIYGYLYGECFLRISRQTVITVCPGLCTAGHAMKDVARELSACSFEKGRKN